MDTNSPGTTPVQWLANEVQEYSLINPALMPAFKLLVEHAKQKEELKAKEDYLKGFTNSTTTNLNSFEL
jgi:hypothetical protein